jgi:NADPH:quinone reductase
MATVGELTADSDRPGDREMLAMLARGPGGPEVLELVRVPLPEPGPGQVRIRVVASPLHPSTSPRATARLRTSGVLAQADDVPLGWDVAGHVEEIGPGVRRFGRGDAVIGVRDLVSAPGSHAEQVVFHASAVSPAPRSVPLEDASTLPLNGLTADRSLELCGLGAGESLLITGAAGEVGASRSSWRPCGASRRSLQSGRVTLWSGCCASARPTW